MQFDSLDRNIINTLQKGFPLTECPYRDAAESLGTTESELISRLKSMLDEGVLTRFGPMFQIERFGGAFTLAAMKVPPDQFDSVAEQVNQFSEVAHNYQRDHDFNMWFVIATEDIGEIEAVIEKIEVLTGIKVYNMPKLEEYFVNLQFAV
ncbi:MAG: Lrp/AsnC family transcriptional regulator [Gammaproteobacteria bacterium]|nr:Lrp/AsnC family transcriptional regulator [Gammaproteobacteria bacterium]